MRLSFSKKVFLMVFATATWLTGACSSDQQEAEEPVSQEEQNNQSNSQDSGGENSSQGEASQSNATENSMGSTESEGNNVSGTDTAPVEPPPAEEPALPPPEAPVALGVSVAPPGAAAVPSTVPAGGGEVTPQANRFVRYIQGSSAAVHAEPNESSATVLTLAKGDHILVSEENGWGKIANRKFIKLSELSNKAVPRDRVTPSWN